MSICRTPARLAGFTAVTVGGLFAIGAIGADPKARSPVPATDAQEHAVERVRDVFKRDYVSSARSTQKADLARQLLEQAGKTADALDRWALLSESTRLAIEAGDTDLAFTAVETTSRDYQVDRARTVTDVLVRLAKKIPPAASAAFARKCLVVVRDTQVAVNYDGVAQKILALAAASA